MKAFWIFLLALFYLQPGYGESLSTRQALIAAPEFDSVVPIGRRMTLVLPREHSLFGARVASKVSFEQAVANLCPTKWLFSRIDVESMSGRGEKVDASLAPQDAASEIFRVGGTDCAEQFRVNTRAKSSFMGLAQPVAILSRQEEDPAWKGRAKALYESEALPPNGKVDGKALGFGRSKINGLESLAWAYAKCAQSAGYLILFQPENGFVQDEERQFQILAFSYADPYEMRGRYIEAPYLLGCRGRSPFVLKVSKDQGMLFEAGRTIESVR